MSTLAAGVATVGARGVLVRAGSGKGLMRDGPKETLPGVKGQAWSDYLLGLAVNLINPPAAVPRLSL